MAKRIKRTLTEGCRRLKESQKRFEDIYNIVFSYSGVFSRTYTNSKTSELTYHEAERRIKNLSGAIYRRVGNGRFIGLYGVNSAKWLLLFWAILRSGNKPYLINLHQPEAQIRSCLSVLNITHIVFTEEEKSLGCENLLYDELDAVSEALPENIQFENEIAITTSGTSLQEKICIYTGKEISAQILNSREAVRRNPRIIKGCRGEIRMLMILPLYHIFGLVASYLWFLFTGAVFVFSEEKSTAALLATAKNLKVTHVFSVPLLWHTIEKRFFEEANNRSPLIRGYLKFCLKISYFLQNLFPHFGLVFPKIFLRPLQKTVLGSGIRFCISGGSYLKPSTMKFICSVGYPLFSGYGSTEIGIAAVDFAKNPRHRAFPCAGKNFSSVEFKIRANGRLFVKGESICKKQIINGVFTPHENWFDTGDVVFRDEKGNYHIAGRESDIVISDNGENLNPDLAEQAFNFSFVENFSVLGDERNERLILILQTEKLTPTLAEILKKEISLSIESLPRSYRIHKVFLTESPLLSDKEIKISRTKLRNSILSRKITLTPFDIEL